LNTAIDVARAAGRGRSRNTSARLCAAALLAFMSVGVGVAAEPSAAAAPQDSSVAIHNFMFSPMSLAVAVGTSVSWKNLDGEPHTIRSIDDTFRSGALDQNDTFSYTFDKPGTYRYVCSIHPQMVASIVVK
jgi:plastocyanin